MAEKEYIKLTPVRQRRGVAIITTSRSNLWLGKDHLLAVDTESYTESYKRFYFRDIQAIVLRKTHRRLIIAIITGFFTVGLGALAAAINDTGAHWFFGIFAGLFAVPFIANLAYGPTCACQLKTAVQTEDVPSISRVKRARKVLARLAPLIAAAQGQVPTPEPAPIAPAPAPAPPAAG
ncbi:MAG: hypothetical protein EPO07_07585 [Verrucomicrobia bacterium]|nr:MAG: hypothetical protein EPO07_07585 [Verrucomicrobiota bacterium]